MHAYFDTHMHIINAAHMYNPTDVQGKQYVFMHQQGYANPFSSVPIHPPLFVYPQISLGVYRICICITRHTLIMCIVYIYTSTCIHAYKQPFGSLWLSDKGGVPTTHVNKVCRLSYTKNSRQMYRYLDNRRYVHSCP